MHSSIALPSPCEFLNIVPVNPLISKCQIKVCYVGDEPNRNRSVITKDVATKMANSLPGSPIVGFYNEESKDFEEHNREIDYDPKTKSFKLVDTTQPYGFVDLGAKVWFQKFLDDNQFEREYLMTEGWLWTGQYPECERILSQGNNQSMELSEKFLDASWTKDDNGKPKFFIINETIIEKLCILGEDFEPCFEGAGIGKVQFSFGDDFNSKYSLMINELKSLLEGGTQMFDEEKNIETEVVEEDTNFKKKVEEEDKTDKTDGSNSDNSTEDKKSSSDDKKDSEDKSEKTSKDEKDSSKKDDASSKDDEDEKKKKSFSCSEDDEEDKKKKYSLEEIPEYIQLKAEHEALQNSYNQLKTENAELKQFKLNADREKKEAKINEFYMLSDEDKQDVIQNIDTYSLDDIESKLSVVCFRKKIDLSVLDENKTEEAENLMTYNFNGIQTPEDSQFPAWMKLVLEKQSEN